MFAAVARFCSLHSKAKTRYCLWPHWHFASALSLSHISNGVVNQAIGLDNTAKWSYLCKIALNDTSSLLKRSTNGTSATDSPEDETFALTRTTLPLKNTMCPIVCTAQNLTSFWSLGSQLRASQNPLLHFNRAPWASVPFFSLYKPHKSRNLTAQKETRVVCGACSKPLKVSHDALATSRHQQCRVPRPQRKQQVAKGFSTVKIPKQKIKRR